MNKLTAYQCLECGHFTITRYDGRKCAECGGILKPMGNATNVDSKSDQNILIEVELDSYDKIKSQLNDIESQIDRIIVKSQKIVTKEQNTEQNTCIERCGHSINAFCIVSGCKHIKP